VIPFHLEYFLGVNKEYGNDYDDEEGDDDDDDDSDKKKSGSDSEGSDKPAAKKKGAPKNSTKNMPVAGADGKKQECKQQWEKRYVMW